MADIQLSSLSKRYGDKTVFNDLSLDVHNGECFTLLGPSGCGKTVLLRLIAGFEAPDSGTIAIGGQRVAEAGGEMLPPDQRDLGMVFQEYAVWPHMSVFDNVAYPLKLAKTPADALRERTLRAVGLVGLGGLEDRLPSQLSGGQQQRVALARALISEPRLLLLDEPLNNLDANLREEMRFEIKALQQELGITILYVTHDQEIALAIADRIAIMDAAGKLRQIGTPQEVYEQPADDFVFRFLGLANLLPLKRAADGDWTVGDSPLRWSGAPPTSTGERVTAGFRPGDMSLARDNADGRALPATIRRASFLGAQIDYLIDIAGTSVRAALPSHEAVTGGLLFAEGETCHVTLDDVHWFDGEIVAEEHP